MNAHPRTGHVILVHGAWADGSCWSNVIVPLKHQGFDVTAAQIPLTSLTDDASVLGRVIERTTGPVRTAKERNEVPASGTCNVDTQS